MLEVIQKCAEVIKREKKLNRVQTRFVQILGVKVTNKLLGVTEFIGRDPGGLFVSAFVTGPLD